MDEQKYIYMSARRIDSQGTTTWLSDFCKKSDSCCIYPTNKCFSKKQYLHRCQHYIGVDDVGLICNVPKAIHFLMSED